MKVKDIMKKWKRELKEQGLWDKEVWENPSYVDSHDAILITLPKDTANGIDHLRWLRLSYSCNEHYGHTVAVKVEDR